MSDWYYYESNLFESWIVGPVGEQRLLKRVFRKQLNEHSPVWHPQHTRRQWTAARNVRTIMNVRDYRAGIDRKIRQRAFLHLKRESSTLGCRLAWCLCLRVVSCSFWLAAFAAAYCVFVFVIELMACYRELRRKLITRDPWLDDRSSAEIIFLDSRNIAIHQVRPSVKPIRTGLPAAGNCPVCGDSYAGRTVYCAACKTPYHPDCWDYVGACSIYACGAVKRIDM